MKIITKIGVLLVITIILSLTQCKKDEITFKAYFYTTTQSDQIQLSLYTNDKYKGDIPFMKNKPTCNNDTLKQKALYMNLKCGKYKLIGKDKQGNIMSSGTMKVSQNKLSSSGGKGGQEINAQGECLIVGLFY